MALSSGWNYALWDIAIWDGVTVTNTPKYKIVITQTSSNHPTITTSHTSIEASTSPTPKISTLHPHIEAKTFKPKILSETP